LEKITCWIVFAVCRLASEPPPRQQREQGAERETQLDSESPIEAPREVTGHAGVLRGGNEASHRNKPGFRRLVRRAARVSGFCGHDSIGWKRPLRDRLDWLRWCSLHVRRFHGLWRCVARRGELRE
jgi:hypothetical protein